LEQFWLIKCSVVVKAQQDPYHDQDQAPRFQDRDQADLCDQIQDAKIETCAISRPRL